MKECSVGCRGMVIYFFFSSRRRNTRFDCDWSSDVCSSDLQLLHWPQQFVDLKVQEIAEKSQELGNRHLIRSNGLLWRLQLGYQNSLYSYLLGVLFESAVDGLRPFKYLFRTN